MRTLAEIESDIRELKREMRARKIRRVSCFNGGLSTDERECNTRMFKLETERKTAEARMDVA